MICGIYQTSSADIVLHLAKMSDMDILVVESLAMLRQALGAKSSLKEALPMVKQCVMINASAEDLVAGKKKCIIFSNSLTHKTNSFQLKNMDQLSVGKKC